jgi:hypothetical protein
MISAPSDEREHDLGDPERSHALFVGAAAELYRSSFSLRAVI